MASVTNSNALKYRHLGQDEEGPEKARAEALRDKILKAYVLKQLRTNESLEQQYRNQKDFNLSLVDESITASTSGLTSFKDFKTSFKDFKTLQNSLGVKQVLRSSGLSEEEIKLLLSEGEKPDLQAPLVREKKLKAIEEKLESRQQELDTLRTKLEQFIGSVPLNCIDSCNDQIECKKGKGSWEEPSRPFVLMLDDADLIPLKVIESNRKTREELRKMDNFKNLEEREPTQTLFIKNLSKTVMPYDLASLMGHFETNGPKIQYRILNGHMIGRAFVTFPDKTIAVTAMNTCDGYILHEKPIVIQYCNREPL